ncbi:MAG: disulfide bond formation protein B [Pseudomonadota bacterium]
MQRAGLGAGAISVGLLLAAFAFQYIGGLAPCPICIWQRWPHGVAIGCAVALFAFPGRIWACLGGAAMITNAGISLFHTGIERGWWPGPETCVGTDISQISPEDLLDQLLTTDVVLCDQVAWEFAGISMASWNGLVCIFAAALWFRAYASSSASQ